MLHHPPDRPPDRHKRHRARVKAGLAVYQVELGAEELSWLIRLHWLAESEAESGPEIAPTNRNRRSVIYWNSGGRYASTISVGG